MNLKIRFGIKSALNSNLLYTTSDTIKEIPCHNITVFVKGNYRSVKLVKKMNHSVMSTLPADVFECLQGEASKEKVFDLWVDGSFLDKDRNKAGVGVICSYAGNKDPLFAIAYNISNLQIRQSKYTELWAASLAMNDLKDFTLGTLTCDSPITKQRVKNFRQGIITNSSEGRLNAELRETPDLYHHFEKALSFHKDLVIRHVNRKTDNMPHSDRFSRVAAKRRLARIFSSAHDLKIPCLYKVVNQNGEHRQAFFFDKMEHYDVSEYLSGSFQYETQPS